MADRIKGITIEIGADATPLNKALKGINDSLKATQTELSDVNRLLKLDPKNVVLLQQKQGLLSKQIANTEKKLLDLGEAKKKADEALANKTISEEDYRNLEREIFATEKSLAKLKEQNIETEKALNETGEEVKETGDNLEEASKDAKSFQDKMQTMASVVIVVKNVAKAIADVGKKIVELGKAGAEYADRIETMSQKFGVATKDLQRFQYASELVDVSIEDFAGSLTKLTANIGKAQTGAKTQSAAFEKLGVSLTDANGKLRDSEEVYFDVIDALGKIENETEADITANALFGKSFATIKPLIEAGSDTLRELGDEAEEVGYVLSDGMIESLAELDDAMQRNKRITEGLTNQFSGGFAKAMTDAQNKLNQTLASKSTQDAIARTGEIVGGVVSALAGVAEFVIKHADAILVFITSAVGALVAANWSSITTGIGNVVDKLKSLSLTPAGQIALIAGAIAAITIEVLKLDDSIQEYVDKNKEIIDATNDLTSNFKDSQATLNGTATEANKLVSEMDTLNLSIIANRKAGKDTTAQQAELANKVKTLNSLMGEEVATLDDSTGLLKQNTQEIRENIKQIKLRAEAQAFEQYYVDLYKKKIELEGQFAQASDKANEALAKQNELSWKNAFVGSGGLLGNNIRAVGEEYDKLQEEIANVNKELEYADSKMQGLPKQNQEVAESIDLITQAEAQRLIAIQQTNGELTIEQETALSTFKEYNEEQYNSLNELVQKELALQETRLSMIQKSDGLINEQTDISLKERAANIRKNFETILKYEQNISKLRIIATTTANEQQKIALQQLISNFSDYSEESIGMVNQLASDFEKGGGEVAWEYVDEYSKTMRTNSAVLSGATKDATTGAMDAGAQGIKDDTSIEYEAAQAITRTGIVLQSQVKQTDFTKIGANIINDIARGVDNNQRYLLDKIDAVMKKLKQKLNVNVSVNSTGNGFNIRGYATGGIAWKPQLAMVAEREPEAIIPLSRMGAIANGARGASVPQVNVTLNAQKVTDAEAYRLCDIVGHEMARRAGFRI